jgi:hypothetical protein
MTLCCWLKTPCHWSNHCSKLWRYVLLFPDTSLIGIDLRLCQSLQYSRQLWLTPSDCKCMQSGMNYLGIVLTFELDKIVDINMLLVLQQRKQNIDKWKLFNPSLWGGTFIQLKWWLLLSLIIFKWLLLCLIIFKWCYWYAFHHTFLSSIIASLKSNWKHRFRMCFSGC